ncbi:MAG: lipopolysaccharide biosynthesis protein [Tannerella sp.]|jgi:O-antigen/teichoic acid export membrane protein|nr:lipopolysaccharide biosynthesis protein [Tannerella sp.]
MPKETLKNKTAKGLLWGGISNIMQQALGIIFGIFLARMLNADDYGLVAMLGIFMGIAVILQDSGFSSALINRPFCHKDYNAVFWFSFGVGTISYILLFLCAPLIARFFNHPELTRLARVQFLWFFFGSMSTAHATVLKKKLMIKERAVISIISMAISGITGVVLAYQGFAYWALVIQTVFMSIIISLLYWIYSPWRPTFSFDAKPLKEMLPFSIKISVSRVIYQINASLFSVLLGKFFTKTETGYYYQGDKWMRMGNALIGNMLNEVTQPVLVEAESNMNRQRNVFRKILRFTCFISFPAMFGLAFVSEEFIIITITEKWLPSIIIMQMLCVWGAFIPITELYSQLVISRNRSDLYLWNVIGLGVVQLIAVCSTLFLGVYYMVFVFTIVNILWLPVWHFSSGKLINLRLLHVIKDVSPFLLITVLSMGVAWFITRSIDNIYIRFIAKIFITAIIYIGIMWNTKSIIVRESVNFILRKVAFVKH